MKKLCAAVLALLLALAFASPSLAEAPQGATFHGINSDDLGIEGSSAFIYIASEQYNLPNWETPIIYVYPDSRIEDESAAEALLNTTGLKNIAETEKAAVLIVNPLGDTWSEEDLKVYEALQGYVFYVKEDGDETLPGYALSYLNMQYFIGEGSGATFINQYISQNAARVSAVMTFGGDMPAVDIGYALPAYIVGGDLAAVNYYRAANQTDREEQGDGTTLYYNHANPVKKVVVSHAGVSSFDAAEIEKGYYAVMRYTMRMSLTSQINQDFHTTEVWTLISRPNLEELGLTRFDNYDTGVEGQSRWVVWVPNEALDPDNDQLFPLVIDQHGGHVSPGFEPEAQGWVQLAGEERFIIFAPEGPEKTDGWEMTLASLNIIEEQFPVDTSRIYATGFSRGGGQVNEMIMHYPEILAAASCMASADAGLDYETSEAMQQVELPWIFSVGTGERPSGLNSRDQLGVDSMLKMNHFQVAQYDYDLYPYWGIQTETGGLNYTTNDGFDVVSSVLRNEAGIPMLQFTYITQLQHVHYTEYARIHWDFMKNYARDTQTGQVIYLPELEQ